MNSVLYMVIKFVCYFFATKTFIVLEKKKNDTQVHDVGLQTHLNPTLIQMDCIVSTKL